MATATGGLGSILADLDESARRKKDAIADQFRELVLKMIRGEGVPPAEDVEAILDAADKTPADLRKAIDYYGGRLRLRAIVDGGEIASVELRDVNARIHEANEEVAAAKRLRDATVAPLLMEQGNLTHRKRSGDRAREELIASASPELTKRLKNVEGRKEELSHAHAEKRQRMTTLEKALQLPDILEGEYLETEDAEGRVSRFTGKHPNRRKAELNIDEARRQFEAIDMEMFTLNLEADDLRERMTGI